MMNGFTLDFFTPFLLLLGGTVKHVSVISALPNFFASFIQLKSPDITEKFKSRKKVIKIFMLLQALMLIPMLVSFSFGSWRLTVYISTLVLFTSFGSFIMPPWGSIMADLVDSTKRGEYFGWRNKMLGLVTIASSFAAGFILHQTQKFDVFLGFSVIFALAFVFRLISWNYLNKMHEPHQVHKDEDYFSIWDFMSKFNKSNFARFVIFVSIIKFCVNIASPFFAVLMLRDLKFGYLTYVMITVAAALASNFSIKRWGMHADKIGNLKVLRFTSHLVAFIPLLWLLNQNPLFLFVVQVFSGFSWAGFNLSASNFIYDASTPGKRTRCIAYYNFFVGLSLCSGALLGGFLAQRVQAGFFTHSLMNIILLSAVLRLLVAFVMPFNLKEVREVKKIRNHQLFFSMLSIKPAIETATVRGQRQKRFFFF